MEQLLDSTIRSSDAVSFVFATYEEVYPHGCKMAAVFPDVTSLFQVDPKPFSPKEEPFFCPLGEAFPTGSAYYVFGQNYATWSPLA